LALGPGHLLAFPKSPSMDSRERMHTASTSSTRVGNTGSQAQGHKHTLLSCRPWTLFSFPKALRSGACLDCKKF
jgi:hypothetical protein